VPGRIDTDIVTTDRQAFFHLLVDELGLSDHPERLTVFMTRSNVKIFRPQPWERLRVE
jgi:hypothetical protein